MTALQAEELTEGWNILSTRAGSESSKDGSVLESDQVAEKKPKHWMPVRVLTLTEGSSAFQQGCALHRVLPTSGTGDQDVGTGGRNHGHLI